MLPFKSIYIIYIYNFLYTYFQVQCTMYNVKELTKTIKTLIPSIQVLKIAESQRSVQDKLEKGAIQKKLTI